MFKPVPIFLAFVFVAAGIAGCGPKPSSKTISWLAGRPIQPASVRDPRWGMPVESANLQGLYRIEDGLYRGGQPTPEGMAELKRMGIKTVINLRWLHGNESYMEQYGLEYVRINMKAWEPTQDHAMQFLRVAVDPVRRPIYVHCDTGSDRAALMQAAYRVVVEGWSKDEAIQEMLVGGYYFHQMFEKQYSQFVRDINVEQMRERLGINRSPAGGSLAISPAE